MIPIDRLLAATAAKLRHAIRTTRDDDERDALHERLQEFQSLIKERRWEPGPKELPDG
jgi:hypothetical protein